MKTTNMTLSLLMLAGVLQTGAAQPTQRDTIVFTAPKPGYYETIKAEAEKFAKPAVPEKKQLRPDFTMFHAPAREEFKEVWHNPPISQGLSGMCWCFSTTSYFESEIARLTNRHIKLSELYTVYWEYVEKARGFVRSRGASTFGEGSEQNAVSRIWKAYGVVRAEDYTGKLPGQTVHDHGALFDELNAYLQSVKASHAWNEEVVVATVRSILDQRIGRVPEKITVDGKTMTPVQYFKDVVRLNMDDYIDLMSFKEKPYFQFGEYEVPDNWWHNADYLNVPLDKFIAVAKAAPAKGYGVLIGGDTSEPGLYGAEGIAVIPTFDIPSAYIDENARQFRFSNGTSGDDHGIHIVGAATKEGATWFLVKDSGAGARNNSHPGYYFYHEDYVKLKMLTLFVHKDIAREFFTVPGR
jgi:bleomycin hydrolase